MHSIRPLVFCLLALALPAFAQEAKPEPAPEESWDEATRKVEKERRVGVSYDDLDFSAEGLFVLEEKPYTGAAHSLHKKTGRVKMILRFKEGKWHGEVRQFHRSGHLYYLAHYREGVQDGLNIYYDEDGRVVKTRVWKDGEVVSETDGEGSEGAEAPGKPDGEDGAG